MDYSRFPTSKEQIEAIVVASDYFSLLWPPDKVDKCLRSVIKTYGREITFEMLVEHYGYDEVLPYFQKIRDAYRQFRMAASFYDPSKCYQCGGVETLYCYRFGLRRTITKQNWETSALSGIVSAITVPLIGIGRLLGPEKRSTRQIVELDYVICDSCWKRNGNKLSSRALSAHPSVPFFREKNFTEYLSGEALRKAKQRNILDLLG